MNTVKHLSEKFIIRCKSTHWAFHSYFLLGLSAKKIINALPAQVHAQLCPTLCDPTNCNPPDYSVQEEYWNGLPFPPLGHLPDPGLEPMSPASPVAVGRFFTTEPSRKPDIA